MSQTQTEFNAQAQRDAQPEAQRRPARPLLWLLLLVVLAAGAWWLSGDRRAELAAPADRTVPAAQSTADSAAADRPNQAVVAKRSEAARATPAKKVVPDRAPALLAGNAQPKYPPSALRAGEGGTVLLNVQVDARGEPSQITIAQRSGNRDLDRAALKAASDWRFTPAMRDGRAVAQLVRVPVEFSPQ
ncbi:MAG: TonB-dependent receptor [Pseudoxanthomonas spadix]|nr:MAG: TonB-dependent receptor [Pseudoxanthomonas spadix]